MSKGYIVRKSQKTIFVRSTATNEEIEFVNEKYGRLGWFILPCKNEKSKEEKQETVFVIDKDFNVPYDKATKKAITEYAKKFLSDEEYVSFVKEAYKIVTDKNGNQKPSYQHIKAKDFIFKTKFPDRFEEIQNRRSTTKTTQETAQEKKKLEKEQQDILSILNSK